MNQSLFSQLVLYFTPGISFRVTRQLMQVFGSPEAIVSATWNDLTGAGLHAQPAALLCGDAMRRKAEQEMEYMEKHRLSCVFYTDEAYPQRLLHCNDAPLLLFCRGDEPCFNAPQALSVVGTREDTPYGESVCQELVAALSEQFPSLLIVSGLARGIDICAHRAALQHHLPTLAVLGTNFSRIYPPQHRPDAISIMQHGALLTEMSSDKPSSPFGFVRRNRIIAGMTDATLVVESPSRGGSLITADLASSYNREVFAVPGRVNDLRSAGCNWLIRTNRAHLVTSAADIAYLMQWESCITLSDASPDREERTATLLSGCSEQEISVFRLLQAEGATPYDVLARKMAFAHAGTLPTALLNLEISGLIRTLPGRRYTVAM